uniref:Uncharacterized protein n=1 Tax=Arundo donax TaxID=35708 RepID=A0A0A9HGT4_ARUDO
MHKTSYTMGNYKEVTINYSSL